ncbi:MAG: MarR family winged helix-turn-helix transcriptional regulator [Cellulosilyticaceae bacterium]
MKLYETESIGRYIGHLHRLGATFLSKEYEKYHIGSGQYQFLIQLYLQDGISHDELTDKVSVDKGTTTRAIKKLEEAGYVTTAVNQQDKRKYHIYLTPKALEIRDEVLEISLKWNEQLVGSLSPDELDLLYTLLRKMARHNPGYFFEAEEKEMATQ